MAKRSASDAALPERRGGGTNNNSTIITPATSSLHCNICLQQLQSNSNNNNNKSSQIVQDFRSGITPSHGQNFVHLSCLVNSAAQYALGSFLFWSSQPPSQLTTDTTNNNNNMEGNQLNHMSNTFHDFLDTTTSTSSTYCNDKTDDIDTIKNNLFNCLSYTYLLSNFDRMIESERLLLKLIHTSQHLFGSSHHNNNNSSCTQAAELALSQKKLRFVIICEYLGKSCCVFRALRYVEDCIVLQGPIENNTNICGGGGGGVLSEDGIGGEYQQQSQYQQKPQQQTIVFPSKNIIPTMGTPVICHGCTNHQTHLNGKIGDVRAINKLTNECQVHFESVTMEPKFVKAEYLRVLFDLPECQNLDYRFTTGELIGDNDNDDDHRYKLIKRVGKGAFGQVVKAIDTRTGCEVAIKIIKRSAPKQNFLLQAQTEIQLLTRICCEGETLGKRDNHIVRLLDTFMHKKHQCIVFEPLAITLYQLLARTKFRGLQLQVARSVAKQLLQALAYLARPDVDIIHCDLKPENIMLETLERSKVKLIDFGSACKSCEKTYTYIQSRFYRSPEVILGLPYSVAIDMWSLGCVLVELYTGEPLFAGSDEVNMIHRFVAILGILPDEMIHQVKKTGQRKFFQKKDGKWTIKQSNGGKTNAITPSHNPKASLKEVMTRACTNENLEKSPGDHENFVDMILQMLTYTPQNRISPEEGLQHPFIVEKMNV